MTISGDVVELFRVASDRSGSLLDMSVRASGFLKRFAAEELVQMCRRLIENSSEIDRLAANSYRHALGFDKLILHSDRPYGQLRLHVWAAQERRQREHVHDHRFDFASLVLAGQLQASSFHESSGGEAHDRFVEDARPEERRWSFAPAGTCHLELDSVVTLTPGSTHALSAESRHRLEAAPGAPVVTLFLETRSIRSSSHVYVPQGSSVVTSSQERLTPSAVAEKLELVVDELS